MEDDVIDHVVLVLGVVQAEGTAKGLLVGWLHLAGRVTHLLVQIQGFTDK